MHSVTILEASGLAGGSSGNAGGLIADWATPKCLAPLIFKTHNELAQEHGGNQRWGYRKFTAQTSNFKHKIQSQGALKVRNLHLFLPG